MSFHAQPESRAQRGRTSRVIPSVVMWLDHAIFVCLIAALALSPFRVDRAATCFQAAIVLTVVSVAFLRRKFTFHPLYRPLVLFLLLALLSTAFSSAPALSWHRMSYIVLLAVAMVVGNNLTTRLRLQILIAMFIAASCIPLIRTAWQYTYGIGARIEGLAPDNPLAKHGVESGDVVGDVNDRPTRTPDAFRAAARPNAPESKMVLQIKRGTPVTRLSIELPRSEVNSALADPRIRLERAHPLRAQGSFYHYVPFAGFMTLVAMLAWGFALVQKDWRKLRALLVCIFMAAFLCVAATFTRGYMVAIAIATLVTVWLAAKRKGRTIAVIAVVVGLAIATFMIHQERGLGWIAAGDAGTEYRVSMWRDGLRLARQHPLLGIGFDAVFSGKWDLEAYHRFPLVSHFHSTPIQLAVDLGLPALAAWIWLTIAGFSLLRRTWHQTPLRDVFIRGLLLGILGALIAFHAASVVHYNLGDGEISTVVATLLGMVVAVDVMQARRSNPANADTSTVEPHSEEDLLSKVRA
jgi:O-Antigen ligase